MIRLNIAGVLSALFLVMNISQAKPMSPDPAFTDVGKISIQCQILGKRPDWKVIEQAACETLKSLLSRIFGKSIPVGRANFGDAGIAAPGRLLFVVSGRMQPGNGARGERHLAIGLTIYRDGKNITYLPPAPRVVRIPARELSKSAARHKIAPVLQALLHESGL